MFLKLFSNRKMKIHALQLTLILVDIRKLIQNSEYEMAFLKFSKLFNLEIGSDIVKAMGFKNDEELIKSIDELIG